MSRRSFDLGEMQSAEYLHKRKIVKVVVIIRRLLSVLNFFSFIFFTNCQHCVRRSFGKSEAARSDNDNRQLGLVCRKEKKERERETASPTKINAVDAAARRYRGPLDPVKVKWNLRFSPHDGSHFNCTEQSLIASNLSHGVLISAHERSSRRASPGAMNEIRDRVNEGTTLARRRSQKFGFTRRS